MLRNKFLIYNKYRLIFRLPAASSAGVDDGAPALDYAPMTRSRFSSNHVFHIIHTAAFVAQQQNISHTQGGNPFSKFAKKIMHCILLYNKNAYISQDYNI